MQAFCNCFCPCFFRKIGHEGKIRIRVKDLEIMNDDPTQVDVLYAKCYEEGGSGKLQKIADLVAKHFKDSGKFLVYENLCKCD